MATDHKRIAKNTLYLYARMILLMGVSLYTSRVVLSALGVEDFGIYNVVGGVVAMMGFLNASLLTSTQRFLNVEMGKGDAASLNLTFCQAVNAHVIIALVAALILESAGMWFVMTKLVIPPENLSSAIWVFQCSILSFVVTIISAPYNAAIIANERMSLFAGLSILDALLKLSVAFIVSAVSTNRLTLYALLILAATVTMQFLYGGFCTRLFKECRYHLIFHWSQMKQMFSFSGWMVFGSLADVMAGQGVNMLINVFFGPVFNAARAIAVQVQGAVSQFSNNFMISVNPQIVKNYSSGSVTDAFSLVFKSSKMSFFLMLMIVTPLVVRMNSLLGLWLTEVPECTTIFAQLILIEYLIRSSYTPIAQICFASGKVRLYQFSIACLFITTFIVSYILFRNHFPVYSTFIVAVAIAIIGLFVRLIILHKLNGFPMLEYLKKVTAPMAVVMAISLVISFVVGRLLPATLLGTLASCLASLLIALCASWTIGLDTQERIFVTSRVKSLLNKIR